MSTDLAILNQSVQPYTGERFELEQRMAKLFAMSGLFNDIKGSSQEMAIAQAYVKIAMGSSMGFSPAESMQGIDIIQGRPSVGSQLRAARMQRAGYSWRIDRLDDEGCELTIFSGTSELGTAKFTKENATTAGLINKDNWKKDPSSMYFARAITRAQRRYAPGVLSLDVMSTEEARDYPEPASVGIAAATDNKTEDLAEKLKAKREPKAKVVDFAPPDKPAEGPPSIKQNDGARAPILGGIAGANIPAVDPAAPAPLESDNLWPSRATQTWLLTLGADRFNDALMAAIGTHSLAAINNGNRLKVWEYMAAAKAKMPTETGPPNSITSPELAPNVKGQADMF